MADAMKFMVAAGEPYEKTEVHLAADLVIQRYCASVVEWGGWVRRYDELMDEAKQAHGNSYS